jgi:hypothetical protein
MALIKSFKDLCPPSLVYFVLSIVGILMIFFQNLGNTGTYNVGSFSCIVPNTTVVFIFKIIQYLLFQPLLVVCIAIHLHYHLCRKL